jgi:hypothetical protein
MPGLRVSGLSCGGSHRCSGYQTRRSLEAPGCPQGAPPASGSASRQRGGAVRRGRRPAAPQGEGRRRDGAQERSSRREPARNCPNASSVSGRSGKRESRVCASRWSTTVPRLIW